MSDVIHDIGKIAKKRARAEAARRDAMSELRELCWQAQSEGVPIAQIARAAGLSRQGVYDLLAARPS